MRGALSNGISIGEGPSSKAIVTTTSGKGNDCTRRSLALALTMVGVDLIGQVVPQIDIRDAGCR